MSTDKQRIAIAEFCGWHFSEDASFKRLCRPGEAHGVCCGLHLSNAEAYAQFFSLNECGPDYVIPDYLNDLNAMRDAVDRLRKHEQQEDEFILYLGEACGISECRRLGFSIADYFTLVQATAAHRAEALLRTLGKWKET